MEMVSLMANNAFSWNGAMDCRRKGFTIIEVIVVLVIGGILMSFAVKAFGSTASHTSARQARNVFNGMAVRARAQAIESGRSTVLIADARGTVSSFWRMAESLRTSGSARKWALISEPLRT